MVAAAPAAGVNCIVSDAYTGAADVLMSYGLGHPVRRQWTRAHVRRGGRLLGWDLGYWGRETPGRAAMRLTLDDEHPQRWIEPMPAERWDAAGIELREDATKRGPIILCGMGRKARELHGHQGMAWELATLARLRRDYPGRQIVWRPKRENERGLLGCRQAKGAIEDVLKGASLVVCHHSNVAVDACIAGVPVQCADGAAMALYRNNPNPTREQRLEFMRSLAWWQWNPTEAVDAWNFIKNRLSA